MRHLNKILGFVAVSFVLVFLGKINKVDLYRAYFKTIAEVGGRNTQDLDAISLRLQLATVEDVREALEYAADQEAAWFIEELTPAPAGNEPQSPQLDQDFVFHSSHFFHSVAPIRGPNLL